MSVNTYLQKIRYNYMETHIIYKTVRSPKYKLNISNAKSGTGKKYTQKDEF